MSAETAIGHLRALWRTERIIADIRLKHLLGSFGLKVFAALFCASGLLLLELAGYFALVQIWSAIASALLLGMVNLTLAAGFLLLAAKRPAPRELALALDIESSAFAALQAEVRANGLGGFPHLGGDVLATVLPRLIPILLRALRKSRAEKAGDNQ